ncbi:MAG: S8 family serine peptidase [Flavobacteriales bacterium]|nr:S8 family serine peptidase [Flavobacteriales bacterium]MCB9447221.1 S8 family serine peptidase [Flavobacteriales bacterium]
MRNIYRRPAMLFCALLAGGWAFAQSSAAWVSKVDQNLKNRLVLNEPVECMVIMGDQADVSAAYQLKTKEEKGRYVYETLKAYAEKSQKGIKAQLNQAGATYQSFFIVNALMVIADASLVESLASRPDVANIQYNVKLTNQKPIDVVPDGPGKGPNGIEWGISMINADEVWKLGFKGQGVIIGGADAGVDWDHPALIDHYRGWNGSSANHDYNWFDAVKNSPGSPSCGYNSPEPCGDGSHGTHTIGTICGDDGAGNQIGVAPEAKWIAARNMDDGVGSLSLYVSCFEWFLAPTKLNGSGADPAKAPHVINNSWECPTDEGCNSSNYNTMEQAVKNCKAAGIVVVVSAANSGPDCNTIGDPAIFEASFAVGSSTSADDISSFSSRGGATSGGVTRIKPNVVAPGSSIRSAADGGGYTTMSGTSMAGPHVVGAVALLISANPSLAGQVDTIEDVLERTAIRKTSSQTCSGISGSSIPNNTWGWGRIDILKAVEEVMQSAPDVSFTTDATNGCNALTVQFTDQSTFNPTSWLWTFGDGNTSTQQNPSHTYAAPGSYTVKLTATNGVGSDSLVKSNLITVGTGDPKPLQNVGAPDTTIGGGGMHNNPGYGLFFDASKDVIIHSVYVYANSSGMREIAVLDGEGGNVIASRQVNLTAGGQRVVLDLTVPAGTGRFMQTIGTSDMYRNNAGAVFPYTINNLVSITESNAGSAGFYYYFYEWEVRETGCEVTNGIADATNEISFRVVPNPASDAFRIIVPHLEGNGTAVLSIMDVLGREVYHQELNGSSQDISTQMIRPDLKTGVYSVIFTRGTQRGISKLVIR